MPRTGKHKTKQNGPSIWFKWNEQIIHLDYLTIVHLFADVWWRGDFALWRVSWWRSGFLVASWLVAKLPGGEITGYRLNKEQRRSSGLIVIN